MYMLIPVMLLEEMSSCTRGVIQATEAPSPMHSARRTAPFI